jgi:hypothetical protein
MKKQNAPKPNRQREAYRGTSLIVRSFPTGVHGKAWCDGREISDVEGVSESDVMAVLREKVDAAIVVETEPDTVPYPGDEEYQRALKFNLEKLSAKQRLMLDAHMKARAHKLSGEKIAEAAGLASWSAAKHQYAKVGKILGESMLFQPCDRVAGSPMWLLLVAVAEDEETLGQDAEWSMRPQLVAALDSVDASPPR